MLALEMLFSGLGIFNEKYCLSKFKRRITFVLTLPQEYSKPYLLTSVSVTSVYLSLATSLTTVLSYCFSGITRRCVHIWSSVWRF